MCDRSGGSGMTRAGDGALAPGDGPSLAGGQFMKLPASPACSCAARTFGISSDMPRARITILDADGEAAVYLVDAAGMPWRVYDAVGDRADRSHAVAPPDPFATHRHFVSRDGDRRVYAFRPRDRRLLQPRLLCSQLMAAWPVRT